MDLDHFITSIIYLLSCLGVFVLGHFMFVLFRPGYKIKVELVENDNAALALTLSGYYLALIFSVGGVINGPSAGISEDLVDILIYGLLAVLLLNISAVINDKLILSKFNIRKEIIEDQNCGTGAVEMAVFIATGLNIHGAVFGQGGNIYTAVGFWAVGQTILVLVGKYYNLITSYDIHDHIERDNVAVGVGFGGAMIAMGNLLRAASAEDFTSWGENLLGFFSFLVVGVILLPGARILTDRVLLPGRSLADELVNQERPNMGAAYLEACSYIGSSLLITWCI
ncbi:MAG: DUF350 domain-containing protein [Nitrospinota bacterium]|nr:DUF350 domain-containing protein [Nitrospinota bacterium]